MEVLNVEADLFLRNGDSQVSEFNLVFTNSSSSCISKKNKNQKKKQEDY